VLEARRAWRPRTLAALAAINLLRTLGRTALGALSLAIGVCALTLLLAATLAFHDTLVGTLLGDAVAINIRASDYVAVITTIPLPADRPPLAPAGDGRASSRPVESRRTWPGACSGCR
jgi:hypothetical protein